MGRSGFGRSDLRSIQSIKCVYAQKLSRQMCCGRICHKRYMSFHLRESTDSYIDAEKLKGQDLAVEKMENSSKNVSQQKNQTGISQR